MSNHYTYRAEWSPDDGEFVGLAAEFPSLSWLAPTPGEAVAGIQAVVDEVLDDMAETGEIPPTPLSERRFSGNLSLRMSPDQHRRLAIEAAEQGVSINQWILHKLSIFPVVEAASSGLSSRLADSLDSYFSNTATAMAEVVNQSAALTEMLASSIYRRFSFGEAFPSLTPRTGGKVITDLPAGKVIVAVGKRQVVVDPGVHRAGECGYASAADRISGDDLESENVEHLSPF